MAYRLRFDRRFRRQLDKLPVHLPRGYRLVYQLIEEEKLLDLLYVGPKLPHLYEQLGLGRAE